MPVGSMLKLVAVACTAPLAARAGAVRSLQGDAVGGQVRSSGSRRAQQKVQIIFARHGHGCHNALREQPAGAGNAWLLRDAWYVDPPLTDCGRLHSRANGAALRAKFADIWGGEADFVGSSSMLRAIETGLDMFPNATLFPLPYVSEWFCGVSDLKEQAQWMKSDRVQWDYVDGGSERLGGTDFSKVANKARGSPSYSKFKRFLEAYVLPDLRQQRRAARGGSADAEAEPFRLVVVTHGMFMHHFLRKYFGCQSVHMKNNEAVLVEYNVAWLETAAALSEVRPASCQPLLGGGLETWREKYLCPRDYGRCVDKNYWRMGFWFRPAAGATSPWIKAPTVGAACCVQQ